MGQSQTDTAVSLAPTAPCQARKEQPRRFRSQTSGWPVLNERFRQQLPLDHHPPRILSGMDGVCRLVRSTFL